VLRSTKSRPQRRAKRPWAKQLADAGQQDSPELRKMIKEELIPAARCPAGGAKKRGLPEQPDVKFQIDIQRQNTLIQALMRDELKRNPITDRSGSSRVRQTERRGPVKKEYTPATSLVEKKRTTQRASSRNSRRAKKFEDLAKGRRIRVGGEGRRTRMGRARFNM